MMRFQTVLRTGVAFIALGVGGVATAQSTLPPPDMAAGQATGQASGAPATPNSEIVITGSRIRHNPLDLNAPRVFIA